MTKYLKTILLLALVAVSAFYSWKNIKRVFFPTLPCEKVITYSIGIFDKRFSITQSELLDAALYAEKLWEDEVGKELFTYVEEGGDMKINLVYDFRQQATEKLGSISGSINKDKEVYADLKIDYEKLQAEYKEKKEEYDRGVAKFNNSQKQADTLNRQAEELNSLSIRLNKTVEELNDLADKLNMKVDVYNDLGSSTGEEFNEGEYISDENSKRINIYQFSTITEARRLLEHEMGHAIGLDHVEDKQSIMYRLNSSKNEKLTQDDIQEVRSVCARFMASK